MSLLVGRDQNQQCGKWGDLTLSTGVVAAKVPYKLVLINPVGIFNLYLFGCPNSYLSLVTFPSALAPAAPP